MTNPERDDQPPKPAPGPRSARKAERLRYDSQHRPVDSAGIAYGDRGPNPPDRETAIGAERHGERRPGAIDPYHRDELSEAAVEGTPARPKAPPVTQATGDGRLATGPRHPPRGR